MSEEELQKLLKKVDESSKWMGQKPAIDLFEENAADFIAEVRRYPELYGREEGMCNVYKKFALAEVERAIDRAFATPPQNRLRAVK